MLFSPEPTTRNLVVNEVDCFVMRFSAFTVQVLEPSSKLASFTK